MFTLIYYEQTNCEKSSFHLRVKAKTIRRGARMKQAADAGKITAIEVNGQTGGMSPTR